MGDFAFRSATVVIEVTRAFAFSSRLFQAYHLLWHGPWSMAPVLFFPSFPILCFSHLARVYYVFWFGPLISPQLNISYVYFCFCIRSLWFFNHLCRLLRPGSCNLSLPFVPVLAEQVSVSEFDSSSGPSSVPSKLIRPIHMQVLAFFQGSVRLWDPFIFLWNVWFYRNTIVRPNSTGPVRWMSLFTGSMRAYTHDPTYAQQLSHLNATTWFGIL